MIATNPPSEKSALIAALGLANDSAAVVIGAMLIAPLMTPMLGMQKVLFDEIKGRIKEEDSSAPYKRGDYFYYSRYIEGGEYPIYARKKGSLDADEEILLDVSLLAGDS